MQFLQLLATAWGRQQHTISDFFISPTTSFVASLTFVSHELVLHKIPFAKKKKRVRNCGSILFY